MLAYTVRRVLGFVPTLLIALTLIFVFTRLMPGNPVWALVGYLPAADGDLGTIAEAYQLPLDAVLAAFAFYARHRSDIDARIAANDVTDV